ncbi:MAG: hypothetical protein KBT29_02425 [Prevotellaceae bacterium]|nr:hypothetical protein [Candidatus Minthosoma caballi]
MTDFRPQRHRGNRDDDNDECHADSGSSQSALAALLMSFRMALCPPQSRSDI